jgi:hypothetical protein
MSEDRAESISKTMFEDPEHEEALSLQFGFLTPFHPLLGEGTVLYTSP